MKTAFLCPYFGKFPKHIQLWLNSCGTNKDTTFFIFTDDKQQLDYPDNFVVNYTTFEELKADFQKKFDFEICLPGIYKLGDYKPLYGYLFEELIKDYDAWGYLDVPDEICGKVSDFVNEEAFSKSDKLMARGHMTIFRNTPEVNRRFMADTGENFDYKDIFSSDHFYNFEEIAKVEENKNTENDSKNVTTKNNKTENTTSDKSAQNTTSKKSNDTKNQNKKSTDKTEDKKSVDPTFKYPVIGEVLTEYAKDKLVYSNTLDEWITHTGIDIKAEKTTVVKASADGTVKAIKTDPRYGLTVVIEHTNGFSTVYSNLLTAEFVKEGEKVTSGQTIGTVGNTASFEILDESHLHFEILKNGEQIDPNMYLKSGDVVKN